MNAQIGGKTRIQQSNNHHIGVSQLERKEMLSDNGGSEYFPVRIFDDTN